MNAISTRFQVTAQHSARRNDAMIDFLRNMVIGNYGRTERLHALFLDERRSYLGDAPLGQGTDRRLSVRMREMFGKALSLNANGIIIAHNHPSGFCRPSQSDISATRRAQSVAEALDIHLIDHLIFTCDAAYSMRAGGNL